MPVDAPPHWSETIFYVTIDNRPEFGVTDALPILLDRLQALDPALIGRIARNNGGRLDIIVSEEATTISLYDPQVRRAWMFGGTSTGFPGSNMGGSRGPDGRCIPIAVEDVIIHELTHASDPWLQLFTSQAMVNLDGGQNAVFSDYMGLALRAFREGGWHAGLQTELQALYDRHGLEAYGFTLAFLQNDGKDRLAAVCEYFHLPAEQVTAELLSARIANDRGAIYESAENWAMNTTERYLKRLFPLTAERDLGDYHDYCTVSVSGQDAGRLPYSHLMAEQEFLRQVAAAATGLHALAAEEDADPADLLAPALYAAGLLQGRHRPP